MKQAGVRQYFPLNILANNNRQQRLRFGGLVPSRSMMSHSAGSLRTSFRRMLRSVSGFAGTEKTRGLGTEKVVFCLTLDDKNQKTKPVASSQFAGAGREFDSPRLHHFIIFIN